MRPALDGWLVVPTRDPDGALFLTPECRAGHPYLSVRESDRYGLSWRGDMWLLADCRRCGEAYVAYLSTGGLPVIHCWAITREQLHALHRLDADTTVADVMLQLGYARRSAHPAAPSAAAPPATSPGRGRWLAEHRRPRG